MSLAVARPEWETETERLGRHSPYAGMSLPSAYTCVLRHVRGTGASRLPTLTERPAWNTGLVARKRTLAVAKLVIRVGRRGAGTFDKTGVPRGPIAARGLIPNGHSYLPAVPMTTGCTPNPARVLREWPTDLCHRPRLYRQQRHGTVSGPNRFGRVLETHSSDGAWRQVC